MVKLILVSLIAAFSASSLAFGTYWLILDRRKKKEILRLRVGRRLQRLQSLAENYSQKLRLLEGMMADYFLSMTTNTHRSVINMRRMLGKVRDHLDEMVMLQELDTLQSLVELDEILRNAIQAPPSDDGASLSLAQIESELEQNAMIIAEEIYRIRLQCKGGYLSTAFQAASLDEYLDLLGVEPPAMKSAAS